MSSDQNTSSLFPQLEEKKAIFFPILYFLSFLAFIYRQLVLLNFWLFRKNILKTANLSIPIVSIGNLTLGGTGKTPIIVYLVNLLKSQSSRVAVVSRNYKSTSKEILKVQGAGADGYTAGQTYGDEPVLIHEKTGVPVYVGKVKALTAKEVLRSEKIDVIFVDDGFQHLRLKRNCNILLLDVTQMDDQNYLFPRGRYREPVEGYKKADIIFWTKTNFVTDACLQKIKSQISFSGFQVDWKFELSTIEFPWFPVFNFNSSPHYSDKQEFQGIKRFVLVSAIARPEFFSRMILDLNPKNEIVEKRFSDHHQYSVKDIKAIMDKPLNFKHFLTTEKDFTKLKDIWPKEVPLGIVKWSLRPNTSDRQIYESVISFLH